MKTTRPIAEQRMSDPQGEVRYIPAEPGTRLLSAYLDLNDKAEPVFFESSRVIAWELGIVADSEGDPRCEWSHPITVGEQLRRSQFFGSDRMHAIVFADGRVELLDGYSFTGDAKAWKAWAARELVERPERERAFVAELERRKQIEANRHEEPRQ